MRIATQSEIGRRAGVDVTTVNKILRRVPWATFKKETIQLVFRIARELGYDFERAKHMHRRRAPRVDVRLPVGVEIRRTDGSPHDSGRAVVLDLSFTGARLAELRLKKGTLPAEPFRMTLRFLGGRLRGLILQASVVRLFTQDGRPGMGVDFQSVDDSADRRLGRLLPGFPPDRTVRTGLMRGTRTKWTRARILATLRARARAGKPITLAAFRRYGPRSLPAAAHREFGSLYEALRRAGGLSALSPRQLAEFKRRRAEGTSPS